jgi:hypothetical protein
LTILIFLSAKAFELVAEYSIEQVFEQLVGVVANLKAELTLRELAEAVLVDPYIHYSNQNALSQGNAMIPT